MSYVNFGDAGTLHKTSLLPIMPFCFSCVLYIYILTHTHTLHYTEEICDVVGPLGGGGKKKQQQQQQQRGGRGATNPTAIN